MKLEIVVLFSYLLGSIPFGYLLTRIFLKKDIRKIGSGNIGATNALRTGNKIIGYSTLCFDILKAVIPVVYVKMYHSEYIFITSLCVFLGHLFPVWLKFKGGKGVATYVGILCSLDIFLGIFFGIIWIITFLISKYSSLSSIFACLSIPIFNFFFLDSTNIFFFVIMLVLVIFTHRENIKRLLNHTESKTKIY